MFHFVVVGASERQLLAFLVYLFSSFASRYAVLVCARQQSGRIQFETAHSVQRRCTRLAGTLTFDIFFVKPLHTRQEITVHRVLLNVA